MFFSYRGGGVKKEVFLQLFNISTFIGGDLSIVEELFSLLFNVRKKNCAAAIPFKNGSLLFCAKKTF